MTQATGLNKDVSKPQAIYLADYKPPSHKILETHLHFELFPEETLVHARLVMEGKAGGTLTLNGENLELREVVLDGRTLTAAQYRVTDKTLELTALPPQFTLETRVRIEPHNNKSLSGLYMSRGIFCTQCEAHGFRNITYYLDRPDALSRFTTTVDGSTKSLPQLLSNGNLISTEKLGKGRHRCVWEDPFPKPCYLFALVAGNLAMVEDHFVTMSGRDVTLRIFVEKGNESRTHHAMASLKRAMRWDEEVYGREYDLDLFMIAAVDDFNFGAMENKGLNVFNSRYVLADRASATDNEFYGIEAVVAHEYFHNWTGDRVTCRDWFQLTLKEGLTVFRDEEFSADMNSRPVKRIDTARFLRDTQFVEDAGPNAHPIRPESYIEINNFYTATVYQKGAAVIRMIHTLIGPEAYRRGTDLYFQRHDGQAVTCDDFLNAMQTASGLNLTQFRETWYRQAGTPVCSVAMAHTQETVTLTVKQSCPSTAECTNKKPFYFPLAVGFIGPKGREVGKTQILHISKPEERFTFEKIPQGTVPSLLRDFSAPVKLDYPYTRQELAFLFAHDTDPFNRYEAGQRLATDQLLGLIKHPATVDAEVLDAFARFLETALSDPAFCAEGFTLPTETSLTEMMDICDFEGAHRARESLLVALARYLENDLLEVYNKMADADPESVSAEAMGMRRLRNVCLTYLSRLPNARHLPTIEAQYYDGRTMTERYHALCLLCDHEHNSRDKALKAFAKEWKKDPLVMNKFFTAQACSILPTTLERVRALETHAGYDPKNPNKIRALVGAFAANLARFHDASGDGYAYIADKVLEIDQFNSNVSGRLSTAFKKFGKLDNDRALLLRSQLERILSTPNLSADVYEIVSKTLNARTS